MQWSDIQFHPPARTLRQFAGLWLIFFGAVAIWQGVVRSHVGLALGLAAMAVTIGPLGLLMPGAVRLIYVGWMVAAFPVGWAVSRVVLALLFYGVFTPVAWLFKMRGRDALCRQPDPGKETYWTRKPMPTDVRRYFNQS